ncbi:Hsp70 family protein [Isosphaeraceae bacterium EP7]
MGAFVGIDLGTTNSVVAARNAYGRPEVLANREGQNITPSVLYFGTNPPAIGQEAKEYARLGTEEVASFFKPQMGNPLWTLRFGGKDYSATELSALVLRRLKENAEAALGQDVDRAVITVPAYFGDPQRKATIEAGRLAGLDVLRIINEPTAAALAYGLKQAATSETVLIYDLGGGTFDVTIARIEPDEVVVLATAGDHDLGGKNWDDRIATFLAERFERDTGLDPLDDPVLLNELLSRSEQAKWQLSDRASTRISLQLGSERRSYELSRAEFEGMTSPLMDRTRRLTDEALGEAGLGWSGLSEILLVGGSTRMPMVRSYVRQMAGRDPRAGVNVDEVVALGAAIQASADAGVETTDATPRFHLSGARRVKDVMSHSLGVVALNPEGTRYVNDHVIRRNLPIPAEYGKSYLHATHGGENDRLEVYLTQGESDEPRDCSILGKYVFNGIAPTDASVTVDVRMSYDENGVVQVKANQRDTGHALTLTVEPVPDDLSWLDGPPPQPKLSKPRPATIYLLIDVSSSMAGPPLQEAQEAARGFLEKCDFTLMQVGLISFSDEVVLQAEATDNPRRVQAAIGRLEADGTTNLSDALRMAGDRLVGSDRLGYVVALTDGYPDAADDAIAEAAALRERKIEVVAIGMGSADLDYLRKLASTEAGSIFARQGELVGAFGHIARVISEGGRGLRRLP